MAVNWYPGHMHKANKEMREALSDVDIIIELLDCRLPYSSQNPAIAQLTAEKPCIKILSKADLADDAITQEWENYFEQTAGVKTFRSTLEQKDKAQQILKLIHNLVPTPAKSRSHVAAMITGIPNVGKSTLINTVAGRKVAKTGNEPAITKGVQKIKIDTRLMFLDTPGILWPKIANEQSGYRLAASGAIRDTAIEIDDIAMYLSGFLLEHYPTFLTRRYEMPETPQSELAFLEELGAKRGCLRGGGRVDLDKVSALFVNEFRSGQLGRISLETPNMITTELHILEQQLLEQEKKRKAKAARNTPR